VTVAQTGRDLTPELVKAALSGPAASQIPPPRINTPTPSPTSFPQTPPVQTPPAAQQGNYGQQFPASGFSAAGSGVTQARPSLGGLMGTSSLPSGAQGTHFSTGMGLPTGPGFQSSTAPGLPRPTAPSGASLPSATSMPGFQALMFSSYLCSTLLIFLRLCDESVFTNFLLVTFSVLLSAR
jgi:epidermal growth factor receptor substrate 15